MRVQTRPVRLGGVMKSAGIYPNQIQFYLKDRGKTAKEMADLLGVSARMFNHYQHGRYSMPAPYRERLAALLQTSVSELFPPNVSPIHQSLVPSTSGVLAPVYASSPEPLRTLPEEIFIFSSPPPFPPPVGSEEEGITYAMLFGQSLRDIDTLTAHTFWNKREPLHAYQQLQAQVIRELERWNDPIMQHDSHSHEYQISRRTALITLATLSTALLANVQRQPSAAVMEEFFAKCSASLIACRELSDRAGIRQVGAIVPKYLPILECFAQQPSRQQRTAAYLTAQGYLLLTTVELHRLCYQRCNAYSQLALRYGAIANDPNLRVGILTRYATRQFENGDPAFALDLFRQALPIVAQARQNSGERALLPRVEGRVYLGLASSLAHLHKRGSKEIDEYYEQAHKAYADPVPQKLPYMSLGEHILHLYEGLGRAEAGDLVGGRAVLAKIQAQGQQEGIEEYLRLQIVNQQARIALIDGDLDEFLTYSIEGLRGAQVIGSDKRRAEILANWKLAVKSWPQERRVLELAEML